LGVILPVEVMLGWICDWGVDENQLNLPNNILHQDDQNNQFPAHPYHHLLIGRPVDFVCHPARGGGAGLDSWLGCE
jgi:hypothetical protein